MKKFTIRLTIILLLSATLFSFSDQYFRISKNIDVFAALFKEVNTYYVDDVEPSKLMRACIDGMLKTLDPFTNYFSESQIENARIQQGGKFGGVGMEIEIIGKQPVITSIWQNQPADKAGLKVGDIITHIDGAVTLNRSKEDVDRILIGQPKTALNFTINRPTANGVISLNRSITREEIQETNVPFMGMLTNDIGCIKLKIFNENAGRDVREAFDSLKRINPNMKGVILDLRGNPGGLLHEAVNIVNIFMEKNKLVVTTKGKVDEWNNTFKTLNEPADTRIPIVVLANSSSASASEIVSGALQDYDRGVVMGQKTYGKGLVQVTKELSYKTMLKVTTAKYYIPSGRCVQALNYAERNEDGSVKRVPDSLKVAFKTANGRTVWDGGGVDPDVNMPKKEYSKIAETLFEKHLILDFATQYALANPSISEPGSFVLTDADYEKFIAFVQNKDYSYQTETEKKLEALKETATEEKYLDGIKTGYEAIRKKMEQSKANDLRNNKAEIMALLENEIVGRYYYAYGKVKKGYQTDEEVKEAIALLNNPEQYKALLTAKK